MGEGKEYFRRWEFFGATFPRHPPREADVKIPWGSVRYRVPCVEFSVRIRGVFVDADVKCIVVFSVWCFDVTGGKEKEPSTHLTRDILPE